MRKIRAGFVLFVFFVLAMALCYANYRLYAHPSKEGGLTAEAIKTLRALKKPMHEGAAHQMQSVYPEGYVFMNAIYALAWCEAVRGGGPDQAARQEAASELQWALQALESEAARQIFRPDLRPLAYGAYYRGWTAYVQGKYISMMPEDTLVANAFKHNCADIAMAIRVHQTPWLDSYEGMAWPADNVVCLAALALHDQLFTPAFAAERTTWLQRIQQATEPATGLIPHYADAATGGILEGPRGSSQALIQSFLPDIDPGFSKSQYLRYREHFLTWRMGLPGFREYPIGHSGGGDIDSGPVIANVGGVATIVGLKAALLNNDCRVEVPLWATLEGLLFSNDATTGKTYLMGALPMVDVFMAWGQSAPNAHDCWIHQGGYWRMTFQGISLMILLVMIWVGRRYGRW